MIGIKRRNCRYRLESEVQSPDIAVRLYPPDSDILGKAGKV